MTRAKRYLLVVLKNRFEGLLARLGLMKFYFPPVHRFDPKLDNVWSYAVRMCEGTGDRLGQQGSPLVVVLMPANYQVHDELLAGYAQSYGLPLEHLNMDLPRREMAERFGALPDIRLLDMRKDLRARARARERLYGTVDKCSASAGYRAIVEFLVPTVRSLVSTSDGAP